MGLIKIAAPLGAFVSAGKALLKNKIFRNSLIGSAAGATGGALINSDNSNRTSNILKGGLIGGLIGGAGTVGRGMYKNIHPGIGPKMTMGGAFKNEMSSFKDIKNRFTRAKDVLNRKGMKVGAENRLAKGKKMADKVKPLGPSASEDYHYE